MPVDSIEPQPADRPASRALAILLAVQDQLPDSGVLLVERPNALLVLVPSIDAWEDWTLHLQLRHAEMVAQHLSEDPESRARLEAYLLVERFPVEVLRGDLRDVPQAVAA